MYTEEKILCLMCESASLSREQLLEHIYEHLGYRRHACHACDYARQVAIKHLACDSATEVDDTDATFVQMLSFCFPGTTSLTDLQCMQCGKEYASEGGRQGHVARKHFIRFLQCPFPDCRFRATYTDDISRHIKNEHQRGRGKEQIPREVALRWDWDKKAFQANLLPQVHICFPRPLPDKDRRRPLSPTRVDVAPSDSALLQLMSDVRQSLREDSPESPPSSGRKRYQSEGGAQRVISSTSSISPPITRVNNNASLSSAHHSKTTTTRPLVPSSTRAVQGINNFVSPEAYLPEQAKPIPFLTALRDVDDNTDGVCEVTKEKVKKRRLDQAERPTTTTTMTAAAAAQVTTKEGENNDKEPPAKRPLPLLGIRAVSPLLGNCPEDNGSQLPLIIDTSRPPPNWRPASANGHYSPVSLSTESKFDRPPDAYSPPNNNFPSSHQQSNALSRTTDFSRPTPVYDSLPQRAPLIADSHQHRSASHGRSQSWNDRQANFGGPPLNRFPHSAGGRSEDHRRQHPPSLGSDNLQCRLCKKTVPESDVERHLWSAHVDAHSYPYKCRICKHPARAVSDILAHASKAHSGCDKSSLLLHTATPSQKAKYEQQKKQCFPNITRR
uniref:C2H2-type domain-containing protein n=1 Tax=Plectus sambesii TaxID=2011161 RepID=A0A914XPT8_9BILA